MIEIHPFVKFVPKRAKYLILGSFPGKTSDWSSNWFYGSKYSQFWKIVGSVYGIPLDSLEEKIKLFTYLKIALSDVIYSCERRKNSNLDINLTNITYNQGVIEEILAANKIKKILFTSKFVESVYKTKFKNLIERYPDIELITLPSPSPRYTAMNLKEKTERYRETLPKI